MQSQSQDLSNSSRQPRTAPHGSQTWHLETRKTFMSNREEDEETHALTAITVSTRIPKESILTFPYASPNNPDSGMTNACKIFVRTIKDSEYIVSKI